uniref:Putative secreted protein n=1 Tax=Anopheles marajoara TaxID=58244 RepID=A0A2M4CEJ7_9DIPT
MIVQWLAGVLSSLNVCFALSSHYLGWQFGCKTFLWVRDLLRNQLRNKNQAQPLWSLGKSLQMKMVVKSTG